VALKWAESMIVKGVLQLTVRSDLVQHEVAVRPGACAFDPIGLAGDSGAVNVPNAAA